jgi:hypothetical protein
MCLMQTVAIPDRRSTPGNKGAYALRRIEGDTAHFFLHLLPLGAGLRMLPMITIPWLYAEQTL